MEEQAGRNRINTSPSDAMSLALMAASEDALITFDARGRITSLNAATEALLGYPAEELMGRPFQAIVPQRLRRLHGRRFRSFVQSDQTVRPRATEDPLIVMAKSGLELPVSISAAKFGSGDELVLAVCLRPLGATTGETALSITQEKLESMMAITQDAMHLVDADLKIRAFNAAAERMFGYRSREVVGRPIDLLIPQRMRSTYAGRLQSFLSSGDIVYRRTVVDPVILARADGTEFHVDLAATKFIVDGQHGALIQLRDVTAAVGGTVLARSQARLAGIINLSEDAIITVDESQRITLFNPAAERIFGYTAEEALGRQMEMLIPPRLLEVHRQHVHDFVEMKDVHQLKRPEPIVALRKDGQEFPCESTVGKFELNGEQILTVRLRDISEKVRADAELATSQGRLAGIIELSEDAIITVDGSQRVTLFNPAAERIFGHRQAEVLGRSFEMLIPRRLRRAHRRHVAAFVQSGEEVRQMSLSGPITALRKNGEEFPAESSVAKFTLNGDQILTVRLRDVSEKIRAEELRVRLLAAEESAQLRSRLISTVSHELRSPLSSILGFTSLLLEYDERLSVEERLQQLRVIEDSTRHLQRIVDDLLSLSRIEAGVFHLQHRPVDLHQLFDSVLASFGAISSHSLSVVSAEGLSVMGDHGRLRQVLVNLVDNALKYSPPGGEIEIRAHKRRGRLLIIVRDHGPGVPPDELGVIFDAFYRSANASEDPEIKSTGLGLAICKGFVEAHGGEIGASLPRGGGLAVSLTLPLA